MTRKFLVLVDGSERSIRTVNYLKDFMPVEGNTRIVLFHVFAGLPEEYRQLEEPSRSWETEQEKIIRAHMEQAKNILITGGFSEQSVEIKFQRLEEGIARDIIDEAKKGYSAVVMSRRGISTALQSIILGSVAVKLLQSLTFIPIIFVGQAPPVKKILLAVDPSPSSMKAVEFVASQLGGHGYEVCIFHAVIGLGGVKFELPENNLQGLPEIKMPDTGIEAYKVKLSRMFQDVKNVLLASGIKSEKISEKIISGVYSRSETIVREAEEGGYSTIVVGRRGLSKVEAFFMGRVGHKVVYGGKKFTVWVV